MVERLGSLTRAIATLRRSVRESGAGTLRQPATGSTAQRVSDLSLPAAQSQVATLALRLAALLTVTEYFTSSMRAVGGGGRGTCRTVWGTAEVLLPVLFAVTAAGALFRCPSVRATGNVPHPAIATTKLAHADTRSTERTASILVTAGRRVEILELTKRYFVMGIVVRRGRQVQPRDKCAAR